MGFNPYTFYIPIFQQMLNLKLHNSIIDKPNLKEINKGYLFSIFCKSELTPTNA